MLISILLINFNSSKDMLALVDQLENEVELPKGFTKKLIVLENGSTKAGEWEALQPLLKYKDLDLFKSDKNLMFTGGNILALERAKQLKSDYVLLLNPDVIVSKNFLIELLKARDFGLASPKIYFAPGFETHPERYKKSDLGKVIWYAGGIIDWDNVTGFHKDVDMVDKPVILSERSESKDWFEETDFCTGCCMLIPKNTLEKVGFLDNVYLLNLEDLDLSVRVKRGGLKVIMVPNSIIWHKNAISKGGTGSKVEDYWQTRNRLIFAFKYAPIKTKILLLLSLLKTADKNRLRAIVSALANALTSLVRSE